MPACLPGNVRKLYPCDQSQLYCFSVMILCLNFILVELYKASRPYIAFPSSRIARPLWGLENVGNDGYISKCFLPHFVSYLSLLMTFPSLRLLPLSPLPRSHLSICKNIMLTLIGGIIVYLPLFIFISPSHFNFPLQAPHTFFYISFWGLFTLYCVRTIQRRQ